MSITVAQQREIIRRRLSASFVTPFDFLSATLDGTSTDVHLTDTTDRIVNGTRLGIGNELVLVRDYDTTSHLARVVRGWLGTEQTGHDDGAIVEIAPRFFVGDITDSMREELDSWDENVFRTETIALGGIDQRAYDLRGALDPYCLLDVHLDNSATLAGTGLSDNSRSGVRAELLRDQPLADFPSGFAVQLARFPVTAQTVFITWAERFVTDDWADDTDLHDDVGLETSMFDVLTYGTMARLMVGKEVGRTDMSASGEDRRATEVPPGYQAKTASDYFMLRDRAYSREARRLRGRYPYLMG